VKERGTDQEKACQKTISREFATLAYLVRGILNLPILVGMM